MRNPFDLLDAHALEEVQAAEIPQFVWRAGCDHRERLLHPELADLLTRK
jgi:hypothetical protein